MSDTIVLISTGGTIAMRFDPEQGGAVPASSGKDLLRLCPGLPQGLTVEVVEFSNIPSSHMTPEDMFRLAVKTQEILNSPDVSGIVITHGTDTMEETAYFLDMLGTHQKPVCFTGAMRPGTEAGSDGPYNLLCALQAAASPQLYGYGVLVVMNGEVHAARTVTKMHTTSIQSFRSPDWGPVAHIEDNGIHTLLLPCAKPTPLHCSLPLPSVPLVSIYSGMDRRALEVLASGADGLVMESYGVGNIPATLVPVIKELLASGLPIVNASRVPAGKAGGHYADEGGAASLQRLGVISSGWLNGPKARLKLMLALSSCKDTHELHSIFEEARALK